jgi:hypothetical protein
MLSSHLLFHQFLGVRPQSLHELIVLSLWIHQIHTPSRAREIVFSPYPFGLDLRTRRQIELRESSIFHRLLHDGIQDHAHNSEHRPMESGAPEIRLHGVGGRQAFFCVPAVAAIPPDIEDVKAIPYLLNPYKRP